VVAERHHLVGGDPALLAQLGERDRLVDARR